MPEQTPAASIRGAFNLSDPVDIRARMARAGLSPLQLRTYDDPENGWVDPLDDDEMRTIVRRFMSAIWVACERAEAEVPSGSRPEGGDSDA